jgi:CheY-like chemotaxis protein
MFRRTKAVITMVGLADAVGADMIALNESSSTNGSGSHRGGVVGNIGTRAGGLTPCPGTGARVQKEHRNLMAEILLIDDEADLRQFLQKALTERGHRVRCLERADAAMDILSNGEFELVVVDEIMPGLHGSKFIEVLRRQGNDIPAILMTGLGTLSFIEPMQQLGARVVPKPAAGSGELLKNLDLALEQALKGEAEIVHLIRRTVKLALKLSKTAPYLRYLVDCELRVQVSAMVNHDPARIKQILRETEGAEGPENSIRLQAEVWHLRFHGESGDYPRMRYQSLDWLHKLLAAPNKLFTVAELRGDPDGRLAADARMGVEQQTDAAGLKQIMNRMEEIEEIAKMAGWSERWEDQYTVLLKQRDGALRGKKVDSPLGKAHHNIATQLRNLCDKMANGSMPRLAAHLRAALKLAFPHIGYYPPPGTSAWQI